MTAWLTCEHPGCKARVSPSGGHKRCQRHRPTPPQKPRQAQTEEQHQAKIAKDRKRRALAGLAPGFEEA